MPAFRAFLFIFPFCHNPLDDAKAKELVKKLYHNVKVLDSGARGSLTTFAERGIGDVLLSWENEALLATKGLDKDKYEIVYPSISILAERRRVCSAAAKTRIGWANRFQFAHKTRRAAHS